MKHPDGTITMFTASSIGVHVYAPQDLIERGIIMWKQITEIGMELYIDYNEPITIQNA